VAVVLDDFYEEVRVGIADPDLGHLLAAIARPDGPNPGPVIRDPEVKFMLVASREALMLAPAERFGPELRADLVIVPATDT